MPSPPFSGLKSSEAGAFGVHNGKDLIYDWNRFKVRQAYPRKENLNAVICAHPIKRREAIPVYLTLV